MSTNLRDVVEALVGKGCLVLEVAGDGEDNSEPLYLFGGVKSPIVHPLFCKFWN